MIGIVREFETPYHDIPGHFIGQCVLPVELIFLFLARGGADKVRTGHQPQSRQGARLTIPQSVLLKVTEVNK